MRAVARLLTCALMLMCTTFTTRAQDSSTTQMVQIMLYNLNYDVGNMEGAMDGKTGDAILLYRNRVGLLPSREIDDELLEKIRKQPIPKIWGAVAVANDGTFKILFNAPTRAHAEKSVGEACRSETKTGKCVIMTGPNPQWLAAVFCKNKRSVNSFVGSNFSYETLLKGIYARAKSHSFEKEQCVLQAFFSASGAKPPPDAQQPVVGKGA